MQLPKLEYLAWALANYGQVRIDLASSGATPLKPQDIGPAEELFALATNAKASVLCAQALAARYQIEPTTVALTAGATHGIWATYAALLNTGDEVFIEHPFYEPLVRVAQGFGAIVHRLPRDVHTGQFDLDAIKAKANKRTKLCVVSQVHNPTGLSVSDSALVELASICKEHRMHLLVDEAYRDWIDFDPVRGRSAYALADNIIALSSLTKVHALPWARAGWVFAEQSITERIRMAVLHDAGALSWALLSVMHYALVNMEHVHKLSQREREHDREARQILLQWIADHPSLTSTVSTESIFAWISDSRGIDLRLAIETMVVNDGVIVAPGVFFGQNNAFRIRFGAVPLPLLKEGLERLTVHIAL